MKTYKHINITLITAFAVAAALAPAAQAALILEETFSGSSGDNIAGSTADSGQTWVATGNTDFKQDGTFKGGKAAYLPFTLTQGLIYTLEIELPSNRPAARHMAGFSVGARGGKEPAGDPAFQAEIYAWMFTNNVGSGFSLYGGNGYNNANGSITAWAGDTMTIVLNTENAADYTVEVFDANGSRISPVSIGTPAIDHVFYGSNSGTVRMIDNLTLSDDISEPSTLAITSITSIGGGIWELTLKGEASTAYEFRSSTTLDFDPGTLVTGLTYIVGTGGGLDVTTTPSGDATVQMSLGAVPANFVRAVGP